MTSAPSLRGYRPALPRPDGWWGGLAIAAGRIDDAVRAVVDSGVRTRDLGGSATTSGFTDAVVAELSR